MSTLRASDSERRRRNISLRWDWPWTEAPTATSTSSSVEREKRSERSTIAFSWPAAELVAGGHPPTRLAMFDGGRRLCARQNAAGLGEGLHGVVDDQEDDERTCRGRYDSQDLDLSVHPVTLPSFTRGPHLGDAVSVPGPYQWASLLGIRRWAKRDSLSPSV